MTTHNDPKLNMLQRKLDDIARRQVALADDERKVRREMDSDIERIKTKVDRELHQMQREHNSLIVQADDVRRQIERRSKELDEEVSRAATGKK